MSRPKIALCITVYEPGGQRVVINEQTRLLQERYEFTLFTEEQRTASPQWLKIVELKPWYSRYNPLPNPSLRVALSDFDLVHCHDSFAYIWEAGKISKPLAVTSYGNCPGKYRGSVKLEFEYYISEPIYGKAYRRADRVIAISRYVRDWLCRRYRVAATLCYLGVDTARFCPADIPRERALLYVGEQSARKGVPALVSAFRNWRQAHTDFRLWLAGFGPLSRRLAMLADDGIDFLGFLSEQELIDRYRRCHAFVTPSYWEGFGLPILEAFATGTPVIARRGYAMTELAGNSKCAVLFDRDDGLTDALEKVSTVSQEACQHARATAEQFSWSHSAQCIDAIYRQLLALHRGGGRAA